MTLLNTPAFFFFFLWTTVTAFECGHRSELKRQKRVVNGYDAQHWPWMVAFRELTPKDTYKTTCGASVIGSRWVLTAEHCLLFERADFHLLFGVTNLTDAEQNPSIQKRRVNATILYSEYIGQQVVPHDIALIELDEPLEFSSTVQPICLPSSVDRFYEDGAMLFAIGHGITTNTTDEQSDVLQEGEFVAEKPSKCRQIASDVLMRNRTAPEVRSVMMHYVENMVCTRQVQAYSGTCRGDSGGPLMMQLSGERWFQFGITAAGVTYQCADPAAVDLYTNVAKYCDFIASATRGEVRCIDTY